MAQRTPQQVRPGRLSWRLVQAVLLVAILAVYLRYVNVPDYDPRAGSRLAEVRASLLDPADTGVLVCAHRGGNPPENSLSAIARAMAMRADIVEVDVTETADGHLVLMHDGKVDRTTDGTGRVGELSLAQVRKLHLRKSMTGESAPTLLEALRFSEGEVMLCLDIKRADADAIVELVRQEEAMDRVIFYGREKLVARVRALAPEAIVMARVRKQTDELAPLVERLQPQLVQVPRELLSQGLADRVRLHGARLWVNAIGNADYVAFANLHAGYGRLLRAGVDVIQTDEPQLVRQYLCRRNKGLQRHGQRQHEK